jgi:hypothetical protein
MIFRTELQLEYCRFRAFEQLWLLSHRDYKNVLQATEANLAMQFMGSKKRILNSILLLILPSFSVSYMQHNSRKQRSENCHVLLPHHL